MSAVGEQQFAQEQAQLTDEVQRYFNEQLLPFLAAREAAGVAFGVPAGISTTEASLPASQRSPFLTGLGGAATGAGLGGMFGGPYGAAIGAGLGGIGSIFF